MRRWPRRSHRVFLVWAMAILWAGFSLFPFARAEQSLPSTPLSLLDGGTLNLQSFKGSVLVVRFLASW